jgi:hypothetical protein
MFRKFLLFLLRVTDKKPTTLKEMTDRAVSPIGRSGFLLQDRESMPTVNIDGDVTFEKLRAVVDVFHNSPVIGQLNHLHYQIENRGYVFSQIEQNLMDDLIEKYNTKHKSPLAKAMSEGNK